MEKMYKVVDKWTRFGCLLTMYSKHASSMQELEKLHIQHSAIFPRYMPGAVLEADPRTEGYFLFQDELSARKFIQESTLSERRMQIVEVQLLDQAKRPDPNRAVYGCGRHPMKLILFLPEEVPEEVEVPEDSENAHPEGTWVCRKIKVLN